MLEGKALIEDTDMPLKMQIQAMASASQALDLYEVFDCNSIAEQVIDNQITGFSSGSFEKYASRFAITRSANALRVSNVLPPM